MALLQPNNPAGIAAALAQHGPAQVCACTGAIARETVALSCADRSRAHLRGRDRARESCCCASRRPPRLLQRRASTRCSAATRTRRTRISARASLLLRCESSFVRRPFCCCCCCRRRRRGPSAAGYRMADFGGFRCFCGHPLAVHATHKGVAGGACKGECHCQCRRFRYIPFRPEEVGEWWLPRRKGFNVKQVSTGALGDTCV